MKRFIQCVCLILVAAMLLPIPAFAAEQRSSEYFAKYSAFLWKTSSTEFEVWFDILALETMAELGASSIKVERSTDQENWETMQTYKMEDYSEMTEENSLRYTNCVTYTYEHGYYYSAIIVLYAKKSDGTTGRSTVTTTIKYF